MLCRQSAWRQTFPSSCRTALRRWSRLCSGWAGASPTSSADLRATTIDWLTVPAPGPGGPLVATVCTVQRYAGCGACGNLLRLVAGCAYQCILFLRRTALQSWTAQTTSGPWLSETPECNGGHHLVRQESASRTACSFNLAALIPVVQQTVGLAAALKQCWPAHSFCTSFCLSAIIYSALLEHAGNGRARGCRTPCLFLNSATPIVFNSIDLHKP
jgi:hypothetical protein